MRCRAHVFPGSGEAHEPRTPWIWWAGTSGLCIECLKVQKSSQVPHFHCDSQTHSPTPSWQEVQTQAPPPFNGMGKLRLKEGKGFATWPLAARVCGWPERATVMTSPPTGRSLLETGCLEGAHLVFQANTAEPSWPSSDNSRLCRGGGWGSWPGKQMSHTR